ncbi:MAG TPA: Na/Pi cotransporter family protein [Candidatus Caccalectryoclostridium excrementigallinarum]|uniref:Na/Pi cotransporter family protein n=1 Tax=Candidatus Caccalectryoclostridium excrementigallinarum TaxID=2840710 RepID=A0A9D1MLY2_9FIRM|nr:Na/Pi cotransporter family protein [Candidatus Caccalectryoclostridium excrementigallinarum]
MAMDIVKAVLVTLGGLGVFLFGMKILGDYLQNAAGDKIKNMLGKVGNNRFAAVGIGTAVTAVIQSSSATTVMVVGFVNAGIMTLFQATGIIMGANIGTTITAQIVALSVLPVTEFFVMLTGIGFFLTMISKPKVKTAGMIIAGFGMIFSGLYIMSAAMNTVSEMEQIRNLFAAADDPFLLFFIGLAITGIVQSSSATTGILITMAGSGLVTLRAALFATLGINIGTCVTALLAGIGANANAKRASVIHLLFNCFGSLVFFILCYFAPVDKWLSAAFPEIETQIAMFHTFFNVITTLVLVWFIKPLVKLATLMVPERKKKAEVSPLKFADERLLSSPAVALGQVRRELMRMLDEAYANLTLSLQAITEVDLTRQGEFDSRDRGIMDSKSALVKYLILLSDTEPGVEAETEIATYHKTISDIDRIADLSQNVMEFTLALKENSARISETGRAELEEMRAALDALKAGVEEEFERKDISLAGEIEALEQKVDEMYLKMEEGHLARMRSGECTAFTATIYIPLINNLERIGDHLFNIFRGMKSYVKAPSHAEKTEKA